MELSIMGKISPVSAKYIVHATIHIEGMVDKPDVIGAIFGLILLAAKTKRFKDKIAFGPFLVVAFFVYIFLAQYLDPYLLFVN